MGNVVSQESQQNQLFQTGSQDNRKLGQALYDDTQFIDSLEGKLKIDQTFVDWIDGKVKVAQQQASTATAAVATESKAYTDQKVMTLSDLTTKNIQDLTNQTNTQLANLTNLTNKNIQDLAASTNSSITALDARTTKGFQDLTSQTNSSITALDARTTKGFQDMTNQTNSSIASLDARTTKGFQDLTSQTNASITALDTRTAKGFQDANAAVSNLQGQISGINAYTSKASLYHKVDDANNVFMTSVGGGLFQADVDGQVQMRSKAGKNAVMYTEKNNKFVANGAGDVYAEAAPGNYAGLFANGGQATVDTTGNILLQPGANGKITATGELNEFKSSKDVSVDIVKNGVSGFKTTVNDAGVIMQGRSGDGKPRSLNVTGFYTTRLNGETTISNLTVEQQLQLKSGFTSSGSITTTRDIIAGGGLQADKAYFNGFIDTGINDTTRELNSGKIVYGADWDKNSLSIVGKGTKAGQRSIHLYDNVITDGNSQVNGQLVASSATVNGPLAASTLTTSNATVNGDATVNGKFLAASATVNGDTMLGGGLNIGSATDAKLMINSATDHRSIQSYGSVPLKLNKLGNNVSIGNIGDGVMPEQPLDIGGNTQIRGGLFIKGKNKWNLSEDANGRLCFGVNGKNAACIDATTGNLVQA